MASKITTDPRIDPRIKALMGAAPDIVPAGDVKSREQLLAEETGEAGQARLAMAKYDGMAAMAPMASAPNGETKPHAGVMATKPTTSPVPAPTAVA